jgi:hypothetical protein
MKKQAQFMKRGDVFVYNGSAWLCATDAYQDSKGRWKIQLADNKRKLAIIPTSSFFTFSSGNEELEVK